MLLKRIAIAAAFAALTSAAAFAQATQPATPARPATPAAPPAATAPATAPRPAAPAQATAPVTKKVNLNTADAKELDSLPQIGEARAKAIIEARTKGGKFKNWDDFVKRNVIPGNAEGAIKDRVAF